MGFLPPSATQLIDEFSRLPGIGRKTAQRLAFHLLKTDEENTARLAQSMLDMKLHIQKCAMCGGITESNPCPICIDPNRNDSLLCVVEEAQDIFAFERTNAYRGKYHVLGGVISPLDGIGPDELNIDSLINRIQAGMEVILATNPSIEGETTSLYLGKLLKEKDVQVTRLARGLPVGGDLEYTDEATLIRAMEGRTKV
ncbi:MAG: recombination protein RecR [Candidatus Marinimicrobia bacterium]|jgi:recombination protein RecR|nr:recombination protein RecR [Candidatus Neomarinimicrobiota bacterium]MBT3496477.1 recombination protein RecR [Candidatus Neomarinimicrobiota bacterium]MBT3692174.1 recombination protein RecR [Candidatus Neomarinimicrobiota bacterium]MBT3732643.1 recombination protein RecR [Candidatus Neomarinimicrobiota bacterium]MBT4144469.1 recombination protein RecR [Candidatus Neomarinimicrobiota bacterium]